MQESFVDRASYLLSVGCKNVLLGLAWLFFDTLSREQALGVLVAKLANGSSKERSATLLCMPYSSLVCRRL